MTLSFSAKIAASPVGASVARLRRTKLRAPITGFLVVLLGSGAASARGTFDATTGAVHMTSDANLLKSFDFETPESLIGASLVSADTGATTSITDASVASPLLTEGAVDAIEGARALRLGSGGQGIGIVFDAAMVSAMKGRQFEVSFWARADGAPPLATVYYDDMSTLVRATRTDRMTSDGWAEFVAGPVDGEVWGHVAHHVEIAPDAFFAPLAEDARTLIDALEIRLVDGAPVAPNACTQANVHDVCGAQGACMFGHCVPSTVTWGTLPEPKFRSAIAERWIHFATHVMGDRQASAIGEAVFTSQARELAKSAASAGEFWGGLARLVHLLRDSHTGFGAPYASPTFSGSLHYQQSSVLGACFGLVEKDLLGGGLGYAVFRTTTTPLPGITLQRGDVLTSIDGRDPKAWVDDYWPNVTDNLPNDPAADWGWSANALAGLVSSRASTLTFTRCEAGSDCTGDARKTITIDIGNLAYEAILAGKATFNPDESFNGAISCSPRFSDSVSPSPPSEVEDPVDVATVDGTTLVQFDGFMDGTSWRSQFANVFTSTAARVLVDARMGHGGSGDAVQYLLDLTRGTDVPMDGLLLARSVYEQGDPAWLFERAQECMTPAKQSEFSCVVTYPTPVGTSKPSVPASTSRIAWLNTVDVSANDFMPRLLQGRANFKVFAPHPTAGAFGSIGPIPRFLSGWVPGTLQFQDSKFGADFGSLTSARWESGHGVGPDVVVVEKLSDAVAGVDTMLKAANAWLTSP